MGDAADAFSNGMPGAGARWADAARSYAALLRQHIDKENNVLFMMAENILSAAEQAELVAAFEKVEEEKMGAGTHERLHALMDKLCAEVLSA
jgi:hemerythrin-like domain-containing protein